MEIRITEQHLTTGADGELWHGYVMAILRYLDNEFLVEPVKIELLGACQSPPNNPRLSGLIKAFHELGCQGYYFFVETPWGKLQYCTEQDTPVSLITQV